MQFFEQIAASGDPLEFCQQHDVVPLVSHALFRHFCQHLVNSAPLVQLSYSALHALGAHTEPRSLTALFRLGLLQLAREMHSMVIEAYAPFTVEKYARLELVADSYKMRFDWAGERYVFHLQQRDEQRWHMTVCYAHDD